jgi:hypothetical protein
MAKGRQGLLAQVPVVVKLKLSAEAARSRHRVTEAQPTTLMAGNRHKAENAIN